MFTGIVQAVARVASIEDVEGIRSFVLDFPEGFCVGLAIGASVAVDGTCLTVTSIQQPAQASFDVIMQSLNVTTLGDCKIDDWVNVERAAKDGAEIGGHPLSGHIDFAATIESIREGSGNKVLRLNVPTAYRRYIFAEGYIAVNGASLTVSECDKSNGWCEVWLIPETRRVTTLNHKEVGDRLNIEIERGTQVIVDTVRDTVTESLEKLHPLLEAMLAEKGILLQDLLDVKPVQAAITSRIP